MKTKTLLTLITSLILLASCGKQAEEPQLSTIELPPIFVSQPIESRPVPIPEARTLKPGEKVTLTGLVMGVARPFVDGRAVFVLGDEGTITPCDLKGDDHCSEPWDACCDPAQVRMAGTAAIQIVDELGKPLKTGLKGVNGLRELSRVTVTGSVAPYSSEAAFIVNADAIHIGVR
jgi:hypothetical protein